MLIKRVMPKDSRQFRFFQFDTLHPFILFGSLNGRFLKSALLSFFSRWEKTFVIFSGVSHVILNCENSYIGANRFNGIQIHHGFVSVVVSASHSVLMIAFPCSLPLRISKPPEWVMLPDTKQLTSCFWTNFDYVLCMCSLCMWHPPHPSKKYMREITRKIATNNLQSEDLPQTPQ